MTIKPETNSYPTFRKLLLIRFYFHKNVHQKKNIKKRKEKRTKYEYQRK